MKLNATDPQTIVALSTPQGEGAIGVVRLSGANAFAIADQIFKGKQKIVEQATHTLQFGKMADEGQFIDEVVVAVFKGPRSYTGEDVVEISSHGSPYILRKVVECCLAKGAEPAKPGEFTMRAFLNGKLDLSQAESVADIIASENKAQHDLALQQMRGGYSDSIAALRNELIEFAALIELELDFSEEDVEFANREKFQVLIQKLRSKVAALIQSFALGNVLKNGIPVAIVGEPNVGKSTLLNSLLQEEKAIVSNIAGTTRDFIEDTITIDGILFRFIDTAGIRETNDQLEAIGIDRSFQKMKSAKMILFMADIENDYQNIVAEFKKLPFTPEQEVIILLNKSDKVVDCNAYDIEEAISTLTGRSALEISAYQGRNMDTLKEMLVKVVLKEKMQYQGQIVTNARHLAALKDTMKHLDQIERGLHENISGEFLSIDIKMALHSLGQITGAIEMDKDILGTIFGKFCIGK
ncbi:MAG: tRNA uridine-5-carboxymethylaminomethyl(34) synthesis GTPase MnmE [Bacteroidetes bacterium]|nr:tRNA uridine-5-carboxymethylaminomethyl(34) synthesis GTPase MnmE [Bacteroidota bacterium]